MSHRMTPIVGVHDVPGHWQAFEALLREYAVRDLAQPHLSTIWRDLENLPARYAAPSGRAILLHVDGDLAGCIVSSHDTEAAAQAAAEELAITQRAELGL